MAVCGGSDEPTQTTTTNQPDKFTSQARQQIVTSGAELAARPYPTTQTPRIAGFTDDTNKAFDMVRNSAGEWVPAFQEGMNYARTGSAGITGEDISKFYNPYEQSVIDTTVEEANRQATRDTIARNASLVNRGSYLNEGRRAVIDNLASESNMRNILASVAQLKNQGFATALQAAQADKGRLLQGGTQMKDFASLMPQLRGVDISRLSQAGAQQQGQNQANLDLAYDDKMAQFRYPQEQLNWLASLLAGTPYGTTNVTSQPNPGSNEWAQIIGAIGTGVGAAGSAGAFG